ncbi:MAG: rhomboid family intramembrane serine protease [Thermodesulfobacteriota bacterium]
MLLPLAGTGGAPSRRPWLTYGVLAACALLFLASGLGGSNRIGPAVRTLEDARLIHEARPYLTLDPRLGARARNPAGAPAGPGSGGAPGKFLALEQAELDGLARSGFDVLAGTPHWRLGVVPADLSPLAFATHLFLHAGFVPLFLNLVLLHLAMPFLEEEWGPGFLAAFGLAAAAAGAGVFALRHPGLHAALVGASGLAAAVVGALAVLRCRDTLCFAYWLGSSRTGTFSVPGWAVLPAWGLREALGLLSPDLVGPAVASRAAPLWAHGTALALGALGAAALRWGPRGNGALATAGSSPSRGHSPAGTVPRPPAPWDTQGATRPAGDAAQQAILGLRRCLERGEAEEAFQLWQELQSNETGVRVSLPAALGLAEALAALGRPGDAARVADAAAATVRADVSPQAVARLARVAAGEARERLVALALSRSDLPEAVRAELQGGPPPEGPVSRPAAPRQEERRSPAAAEKSPRAPSAPVPGTGGTLRAVSAAPLALADGVLRLEVSGSEHALTLSRVRAMAAAAVDDAAEANLVLDLFLESPSGGAGPAKALRFETHRFDPRLLIPTEADAEEAFLSLAGAVLAGSGAAWLLGEGAHRLRRYPTLEAYEQDLLRVLRLGPG